MRLLPTIGRAALLTTHNHLGHVTGHAAVTTGATHIRGAIQIITLVARLDSDYQVGAVGDHHVSDLVQSLAGHLDPIHLDDLVADAEQARALGEAAGHQPRNEDARHLKLFKELSFEEHDFQSLDI